MGGAVYFENADGDIVQVSADNPLPVASAGATQQSQTTETVVADESTEE